MPVIKLLDQATINQIAAGEVIERPASVVKELFENAVDAKATAVTVEIREGGISLIRVTDNGCGIDREEVPLAFKRHATSKIRDIMDLVTVSSLGFRGEALSSIASVAQVEMITKPAQTLLGISYQIEDGEEKQLEEIGAPDGTTILVRNLFAHVPARRKFLKSPVTEANHIAQLMENMALSRPELSVRFISNGQNRLYTNGSGRMKELIYTIYGREIASNLLEVSAETDCFRISGYIGKPIISRGNRSFENYYINGRFIKSSLIAKAIETAYKSFMMQHRYPFTVLHLEIDPELIDVNVHPSKMELRFRREEDIYNQLVQVLEGCLRGRPFIPDVALEETAEEKKPVQKGAEPFETLRTQAQKEILPPPAQKPGRSAAESGRQVKSVPGQGEDHGVRNKENGTQCLREPSGYEAKQNEPADQKGQARKLSASDEGASVREAASGIHRRIGQEIRIQEQVSQKPSAEPDCSGAQEAGTNTQDVLILQQGEKADSAGAAAQENTGAREAAGAGQTAAEEPALLLSKEGKKHHRLIGQLFETYWLIQYEDKLYIMDQHAAHEKVLYERLTAAARRKERLSQMLSPAIMVTLNPLEEEVLKRHMQVLYDMGYEIEAYGGKEYALCAVPSNMYGLDEKEVFVDLLEGISDCQDIQASDLIAQKLASMSCRAAIKGNQAISFQEADALISQLLTLENPYACPHGRPTLISMSRYELEKKFKRIV